MARTVGIGNQDFEAIQKQGYFYIDKTRFIREWWESGDEVTLITRPRRFGKTLNMSMLEKFFSIKYANRGELCCGRFPERFIRLLNEIFWKKSDHTSGRVRYTHAGGVCKWVLAGVGWIYQKFV